MVFIKKERTFQMKFIKENLGISIGKKVFRRARNLWKSVIITEYFYQLKSKTKMVRKRFSRTESSKTEKWKRFSSNRRIVPYKGDQNS